MTDEQPAEQPIPANPEPITTPETPNPIVEAPFGYTVTGRPKKSAAGKPRDAVKYARRAGEASAAKREAEKRVKEVIGTIETKLTENVAIRPDAENWRRVKNLSKETKDAVLLSTLGPDVDKFRSTLADKFIAIANKMADAIHDDIADMKPGERAFALSVLIDKSELMRSKLSSLPTTAQVNVQINSFGDGELAREKLIAALTGNLTGEKLPTEPIEAHVSEPGASSS